MLNRIPANIAGKVRTYGDFAIYKWHLHPNQGLSWLIKLAFAKRRFQFRISQFNLFFNMMDKISCLDNGCGTFLEDWEEVAVMERYQKQHQGGLR
jgi:hypothetical protein